MNLNFYSKAMNLLISFKKAMVLSVLAVLVAGSVSAQLTAGALNFDGVNDNVSIPLKSELNVSKAITIEAWVNPTDQNANNTESVISKATLQFNNGYIFPRTSSGWETVEFLLYINGYGWKILEVPYGLDKVGQWHHLAATYDGVKMQIYIDGVLAGGYAFAGTIATNNNALTLGTHPGYPEYFEGDMDEARIWNRALSQCEIANNMFCELANPSTQTGLVAYYKFNQGLLNVLNLGVTQLIDSSPTGANGTLNNFGLLGLVSNWSAGKATGTCSVFSALNVTATADQTVLAIGGTIRLHASGGTTYSWAGPNGFTSTSANPVITGAPLSASGIYTVTATTNGCSGTASVNVTVALMASGLNFDGTTNSISVPYKAGIINTDAFTIESWIYPTSSNTIIQNVVSNGSRSSDMGVKFPKTNDRWTTFTFELSIDNSWKTLTGTFPTSALGQWNHLAATYDGYFMRIYLNGALAGSLEVYGKVTSNTNNITIGNQDGRGEFFKGSLDELRIWSRALSQCEIINNMQTCELNGDNNAIAQQNGLAAYYRFNQGLIGVNNSATNVLADSSGHGNNGTLNNFVLTGTTSNWVDGKVSGLCAYFAPPLLAASANGSAFQTGSVAKLFATGGNNVYAWTGPNSFATSTQNPVLNNVQPVNSGTYTVSATYVNCVVNASTRFTVGNVSPIIADGPTNICPSSSVGLSTSASTVSGATYQWYKNDVAINGAVNNQYVATQAGNYTVTTTTGADVIVSAPITVTVLVDNIAPVANVTTLPTASINAGDVLTAIPTATDNCRGVVNGTANRSLTFGTPGTYTITWTYDDLNGNTSTQTQSVLVIDNVAPVLTVPSNMSAQATTGICTAVVNFTATATDNVGGAITITYSKNPNTAFPIGVTTVNVTATDASNNSSTGSFTVTVTAPPVAPITGTTTLCAGATSTLSSATLGGTWSSDNSAVAIVNASGVVTAQAAGTAIISYTDACGSVVTATVTVNAIPATPDVTAVNNCGNTVLTTSAAGTLLWSNSATTSSITVTTGGTYSVTQKVNGCTSAAGSAVAAPIAAPAVPSVSATQPTCSVATGTIVVNSPSGFSYSIDGTNYQASTTFSGLAAGSYTVSVQNGICVTTSAAPIVINAQPVTPATPSVSVTQQPSCSVATGTIVVNSPSGFTYSLDGVTYQTSTTFNGVAAGTYTVYAKNGSCVSAGSTAVTVNAQPSTTAAPTVSVTQPSCSVATGTIVVTAPSGLTYSLDGITYQSSNTFSGLAAGSYTVYVTNGSCVSNSATPVVINAQPVTPAAPTVSVIQQPSCSVATGTIVVSAPSGFSYSIDGVTYQASATFSGVAAGTYTVYAKNGSCVSAGSTAVTVDAQPATPASPTVSVTQPTCSVATGTIAVSAPSGLSYSIDGITYQSSNTFSGLAAGSYTVYVTNGSCVSTSAASVVINAQPATPATPVVSVTQPTCSVATGTIVVSSPSGFTYSLDGVTYQASATFSGVATGTYTVYAKSGSCVSTGSTDVTVNAQPATPAKPTVSVTQPSCSVATGTIVVSAPAGLSYSLNGTTYQSSNTFTGVTAGTYTVYVTNGSCVSTSASPVVINAQPATPAAPVVSVTQPTCSVATGTIVVSTASGLSYSLNGTTYQSGNTFSGLATGSYTVYVTNGSCVSTTAVVINAQPVTPAAPVVSVTQPTCSVATGTIVVSTPSGLSYSLNGTTYQTSNTFSALAAGSYTVYVTNGSCVSTTAVVINAQPATPATPVVSVTLQPTCSVATGTIVVSSPSGLSYSLDGITYQASTSFSGLVAGTYTVYAKNASCVSAASAAVTVNAQPATPAAPVVSVTQPTCSVATATITFVTPVGTGITYSVDGINYQSSNIFAGLAANRTYTVYVKNASSCIATGSALVNAQPATPVVGDITGTTSFAVGTSSTLSSSTSGGVWSSSNTAVANVNAATGAVTGVSIGTAVVTYTVTNGSGCSSSKTATVSIVSACSSPIIAAISNINANATANCAAPVSYTVNTTGTTPSFSYIFTGATSGSGTGNGSGSVFNLGTTTVAVKATNACGTYTANFTVTVVNANPVTASIAPSSADAFCNSTMLTGSANGGASYKWVSPSGAVYATSAQISLNQTSADGVYKLYTTGANGCAGSGYATYNFQKQNLISSYSILAFSQIQLGSNNTVNGGLGVTSPWGYIGLSSYTNITAPGSFVKAAYISAWGWGINIANPIYAPATGITLPTMYYNTGGKADGYPSYTVNNGVTTTLNSNYKTLTLKKGSTTILNGTIFGSITVEQGAQVTFTAANINIDKLKINKGPRYGYTYVRFSQDAKVLISTNVTVSSNCFINPDNNNVTFYLGDYSPDTEKFTVKGGDTKINANIYAPKGTIKATGGYRYGDYGGGYGDCDKDDDEDKYYGQGNNNLYMTGFYIADQIVGDGKNVVWNTFDCSAAPVAVINTSVQQATASTTKETSVTASTTEEELKITVMPNPSTTYFTLKFESKYETPVNMRVMDANGRVVDAKSKIGSNSTIQIGANYASGTYYAEMIQGTQRKVVQLMKVK